MERNLLHILAAREARADRQKHLLAAYPGGALLCLTVNLPGPVKRTPDGDRVFRAGFTALRAALALERIALRHGEVHKKETGNEAYLILDGSPAAVKAVACRLEESLPYGRLLDADVLDCAHVPLSRTVLGFPERGCMVCGKPGAFCASRRAHPLPELLAAFHRLAATCPEDGL